MAARQASGLDPNYFAFRPPFGIIAPHEGKTSIAAETDELEGRDAQGDPGRAWLLIEETKEGRQSRQSAETAQAGRSPSCARQNHMTKVLAKRILLAIWKQIQTNPLSRPCYNRVMMWRHNSRPVRMLDIGPGGFHLAGFETVDVVGGRHITYVLDASGKLPFRDATFDLIHASHVLEHIPWYQSAAILAEWWRVLKPGGSLEVWVPDAFKICNVLLDAENGKIDTVPDGWCPENPKKSPYLWAAGRLFWGANPHYPSWHRALFTPGHLKRSLEEAGFSDVRLMDRSEVRATDHGWINLGMKGTKPS